MHWLALISQVFLDSISHWSYPASRISLQFVLSINAPKFSYYNSTIVEFIDKVAVRSRYIFASCVGVDDTSFVRIGSIYYCTFLF